MEGKRRPIYKWPKDDQPREKMKKHGAAVLSDSELLAILILGGPEGQSAVDIGREVLKICQHSLLELGRQSVHDLMKIKGIGEAKACTLLAALELGRRWYSTRAIHYPVLKDSRAAENYLRPLLEHQAYEVFGVLYLAQSGKIKQDFEIISTGGDHQHDGRPAKDLPPGVGDRGGQYDRRP